MKTPILCLVALLSAGTALAQVVTNTDGIAPASAAPKAETLPLTLGAKTAEGFDDPDHVHFFRYQLFLRKTGLDGLDASGWAALGADERAARLKAGEAHLADLFAKLLAGAISPQQMVLVQAVWGPEVGQGLAKVAWPVSSTIPSSSRRPWRDSRA